MTGFEHILFFQEIKVGTYLKASKRRHRQILKTESFVFSTCYTLTTEYKNLTKATKIKQSHNDFSLFPISFFKENFLKKKL